MNAAAKAAVRLGLDRGHTMLGINGSFEGLVNGDVVELKWGDVEGWTSQGGAELGISRRVPTVEDLYAIGRGLERQGIDGLLIIGGWDAFNAAHTMQGERERYPAFQIPMIVLPATIDNDIPNSELSVGADSALNLIVDSIDRIRQSGTAARRCFVMEVMGGFCGYLAVMGGLSGGAVRVYTHEEGISLKQLAEDIDKMVQSFRGGQRLFLVVRNERASEMYTSDFLCRIFEQESEGLFDAREVVLGHIQQGGNPTPFDRILATRLASHSIDYLSAADRGGQVALRGDRPVRGQGPHHLAAPVRGARAVGVPAPDRAVVAGAARHHRRAGRPAVRRTRWCTGVARPGGRGALTCAD